MLWDTVEYFDKNVHIHIAWWQVESIGGNFSVHDTFILLLKILKFLYYRNTQLCPIILSVS